MSHGEEMVLMRKNWDICEMVCYEEGVDRVKKARKREGKKEVSDLEIKQEKANCTEMYNIHINMYVYIRTCIIFLYMCV